MKNFFLSLSLAVSLVIMGGGRLFAQQLRVIKFDNPKLTVCLPPKGLENGKAVVALPGGAYKHLSVNNEGFGWAPFFNENGITFAVLEYSMPQGDRTRPMGDVDAAFKILTDSATVWGFSPDSIGIMGSSAGGHLASTMSTHSSENCKPAFQILFYPLISLDPSLSRKGSTERFLGDNPSAELIKTYSSDSNVSHETPRAILMLCSDDRTTPIDNSLRYYQALIGNGVPASLHIYPTGGHGWGCRPTFTYHDEMQRELRSWLKSF